MRVIPLLAAIFLYSAQSSSQQTPAPAQRDPQALAVLQSSIVSMGVLPRDSTASGTVTIVEGSSTSSGTIQIQTRGLDQTSEQLQLPSISRVVVYSKGEAAETIGTQTQYLQAELAVTSQCPAFPLPLLVAALNNPDTALQYVGLESENGLPVHHLRYWNSFASHTKLQFLADFTTTDLWINANTGRPQLLSYFRRAGRASEPRTTVDVYFSSYQNVGGIAYPFLVQKSLNGSSWMTITITNVAFNTGLTDSSFPVQ
jgi:hypothetical protein